MITNAQKFFDEDSSMTSDEKQELRNSVNKLNANNPVLNFRIKMPERNGSLNISIYVRYSRDNSGEAHGFIGKLANS